MTTPSQLAHYTFQPVQAPLPPNSNALQKGRPRNKALDTLTAALASNPGVWYKILEVPYSTARERKDAGRFSANLRTACKRRGVTIRQRYLPDGQLGFWALYSNGTEIPAD